MNLTPVSEIPSQFEEGLPNIAWQFKPSPYVDYDQIGLHIPRMERLLWVAGFNGVIISDYQDSVDQQPDAIGIADVHLDGTATAFGGARQVKTPLQRHSFEPAENHELGGSYVRPTLRLEVNRSKLASQGSDMMQPGMSCEQGWSHLLDGSIRQGIRKAGWQNMIAQARSLHDPSDYFAGLTLLYSAGEQVTGGSPGMLGLYGATYGVAVIGEALKSKSYTGSAHLKERNWSLLPIAFHPDRIAVAGVMSAVPGLIRHIKPRQE